MINKSNVVLAAAVLTASIASPAFAQSSDHTGSQMPNYYDSTGKQTWGSWGPQDAAAGGRPALRNHTLYGYAPPRHHRRAQ